MLRFSLKYYIKCILLSIAVYFLGGALLGFFATEVVTAWSVIIPVFILVVGITMRTAILAYQCDSANIKTFTAADCFKMCVPSIVLFLIIAILGYVDTHVADAGILTQLLDYEGWYVFLVPGALSGVIVEILTDCSTYSIMCFYTLIYVLNIIVYMTVRKIKYSGSKKEQLDSL